jgi:hypothetical protein
MLKLLVSPPKDQICIAETLFAYSSRRNVALWRQPSVEGQPGAWRVPCNSVAHKYQFERELNSCNIEILWVSVRSAICLPVRFRCAM